MSAPRSIGPVGTAIRAALGVALVAVAVNHGTNWWEVLAASIVLPAVAVGVAVAINAALKDSGLRMRARSPWSPAQIATAVIVITTAYAVGVALTYVLPVDGDHIFLFFGLSMLLASVRGYNGCEVLAIPNLVMRRHDAMWCPLYSTLERIEGAPEGSSAR